MKRISLWLMLLILTPGVCEAYGYGSYSCGVRYSPYAFNYRNSGLVSCDVDYTPYAFNYRHSGLVPGYSGYASSYSSYGVPVVIGSLRRAPRPSPRMSRPPRRHAQAVPRPVRSPSGVEIIRGHLLAKGITSMDINRVFMVGTEVVSADFYLKDRNLLIKYRNAPEIEALTAGEAARRMLYENYREKWTQIAARHEQNGGEVYYVEASDAETIVAALDSCPTLDLSPSTGTQTVMYAKN